MMENSIEGMLDINIGAILAWWGACIVAIPWWVWIVLVLAGAALGAITYFAGRSCGRARVSSLANVPPTEPIPQRITAG